MHHQKNRGQKVLWAKPQTVLVPEFSGSWTKPKTVILPTTDCLSDSQRSFAPEFQLISADLVAEKYRETPPMFPACRTHSLKA